MKFLGKDKEEICSPSFTTILSSPFFLLELGSIKNSILFHKSYLKSLEIFILSDSFLSTLIEIFSESFNSTQISCSPINNLIKLILEFDEGKTELK